MTDADFDTVSEFAKGPGLTGRDAVTLGRVRAGSIDAERATRFTTQGQKRWETVERPSGNTRGLSDGDALDKYGLG